MTKFEKLKFAARNTSLLWQHVRGIAPDKVAAKLENANLNGLIYMTDTLEIWINKGAEMTEGELILAVTNLGAVVESWLRFFYCVYYDDYIKEPIKKTKGTRIMEPEKAQFIDLINYGVRKLWNDKSDPEYVWVDSVRVKRNAIHIYQKREIGTAIDFLKNIEQLYTFVEHILLQLPPLEDCLEEYPIGYVTYWS